MSYGKVFSALAGAALIAGAAWMLKRLDDTLEDIRAKNGDKSDDSEATEETEEEPKTPEESKDTPGGRANAHLTSEDRAALKVEEPTVEKPVEPVEPVEPVVEEQVPNAPGGPNEPTDSNESNSPQETPDSSSPNANANATEGVDKDTPEVVLEESDKSGTPAKPKKATAKKKAAAKKK